MFGYDEFEALSRSADSEARGMAAHYAALAYLNHSGPADEHAALYAALLGFLEDNSVKVRAAMAYGLLHAEAAPRPVMLALLHDSAVIARAVLQYSPVLVDADILPLVSGFDDAMLLAAARRARIGTRLAEALIARRSLPVTLHLLGRRELSLPAGLLAALASEMGAEAALRGALLSRPDLPADARLGLVREAVAALRGARIVKGAIGAERLERLMRNVTDNALTTIGEKAAGEPDGRFADALIAREAINSRVLLHALVNGQVLFFSACCAALCETPPAKVFTLLETGSRPALNALFTRCGLGPGLRNLFARLIGHARTVDLADDAAARHYVVTALTEELIAEHEGDIPEELADAFAYLGEQNIKLARAAARGVMAGFVATAPRLAAPRRLALPAA